MECILLHNTFPSATVLSFYIFTCLMFRKLNKLQLRFFKWKDSFIFRYIKVFQVSLVVFVLREYILKVHILVRSEHKLCQIWNTCIYWSIAFINKLLIFFFKKAYYQELYILIIEYSSVVTVAEWLDGSFESRPELVRFPKAPKYEYYVFKPKTVKG